MASETPRIPDLADVAAAAATLAGVAQRTPMRSSRWLSDRIGGEVRLKCENLQRTGSFKIRGAYTRIARMDPATRARGVVAASAGNHAQGVALAAQLLGVSATVFTPVGASLPKLAATRGYGADVRETGRTIAEAISAAIGFAAETGAELIHPYDHADIVAGQGTVGLEIAEQFPEVRTVLVCTGGGGLLAGTAMALKETLPGVRVVGVQAAGAAAWPPSLAAGHPIRLEAMATMADGIAVPEPGAVPFELVRRYVDEIRTVAEDSIAKALLLLMERGKLVVEPAGAAGVAALLEDPGSWEPPVAVVISGGNADPVLLMRVLLSGLSAAGRYLTLRIPIADEPGALADLLGVVGAAGGNVVEVEHDRIQPDLGLREVEVALTVETRGPAHCEALVDHLTGEGYRVRHS